MTLRVVVTGAGSGFGAAVAERLLQAGHAVVGTDVDPQAVRAALGSSSELTALRLELREPGGVASAGRAIAEAGPVHALVNNAGYAVFGALDDADLDAVAAMFDANVLGQVRVTRALLPALRATRGTVVYLSSVAGKIVFAESGFYAASKHAVEALAEATYVENAAYGLRVVVVEPGAFQTGFAARATAASRPRPEHGVHAHQYAAWDATKRAMLEAPQPASLVAEAIVDALSEGPPFQRLAVGVDAQRIVAERGAVGDDAWVRGLAAQIAGHLGPTSSIG